MGIELIVKNLACLRDVRWEIPVGLCTVVGPNGSGKSNLLGVLGALNQAFFADLASAVATHFGGASSLRNAEAARTDEILICARLADGSAEWRLRLAIEGAGVSNRPDETLLVRGREVLRRAAGASDAEYEGKRLVCGDRLAFRQLVDLDLMPHVKALAEDGRPAERLPPALSGIYELSGYIISYDVFRAWAFPLSEIQRNGSQLSAETAINQDGKNVFTVLRNWRDQRRRRDRFDFVLDGLREAFPGFEDFDFETAGTTVTVAVHGRRGRLPIAQESTGFIAALLHLVAVASASDGTIVAIDEVENSLHPEAIRSILRAVSRHAASRELSVVLATHSPVVLDFFKGQPERVFVMQPNQSPLPKRLDELLDGDYLRQFSFGDLYEHRDFGAPAPPTSGT